GGPPDRQVSTVISSCSWRRSGSSKPNLFHGCGDDAPRLAIQMGRKRKAEQFQDSGSQVNDRRFFYRDLLVLEQDNCDQASVNAVLSTPGIDVVFTNRAGYATGNGIPGRAKAFAVAHQQIGRVIHVWSGINAFAVEYTSDADFTRSGILQPVQLLRQLFFQAFGFGLGHNAFALATLNVQVQTIQAHGVGAGAPPANILHPIAPFRFSFLTSQTPLLV